MVINVTKQNAAVYEFLLEKILVSNPDTGYHDRFFLFLISSCRQTPARYFTLVYDHFHPHVIQLLIIPQLEQLTMSQLVQEYSNAKIYLITGLDRT
jgi:hypothetical protein